MHVFYRTAEIVRIEGYTVETMNAEIEEKKTLTAPHWLKKRRNIASWKGKELDEYCLPMFDVGTPHYVAYEFMKRQALKGKGISWNELLEELKRNGFEGYGYGIGWVRNNIMNTDMLHIREERYRRPPEFNKTYFFPCTFTKTRNVYDYEADKMYPKSNHHHPWW